MAGSFLPAFKYINTTLEQVFKLSKKQKLCSTAAINMLFAADQGAKRTLAYPLRALWRENPGRHCDATVQILISIPKKRLHNAVDRVKMRRRVREAFRLYQHEYPIAGNRRIDMAFIYVGNNLEPYTAVEQAMKKILSRIND